MKNIHKQAVCTGNAPEPVGPYSQAIVSGSLVFISGQLGFDKKTDTLATSVQEQTRLALENVRAIMTETGGSIDDVLKTTVLLADMKDFPAMNQVYAQFFTRPYPARAAFQVAKLPLDAMVEIEAVARLKER